MDEIFLVNSSSFQDFEVSASLRAGPGSVFDLTQAATVTGSGAGLTSVTASYIVAGSNTTASLAETASWAPQNQDVSVNTFTASVISASLLVIVPPPINPSDAVTKDYVDNLSQQGLDFYFRSASADFQDYYQMRRLSIPLSSSTSTFTVSNVSASQYFVKFLSGELNTNQIAQGRVNVRYHMWYNAGGSRTITVAPELYLSSSAGESELAIASDTSLNGDTTAQYLTTVTLTSSVNVATTDRIVCKFKAVSVTSSPINVSYEVEGDTSAGINVPIPSSNFVLRAGDTMTGPLTASIYGDVIGTASYASFATSASWAPMPLVSDSASFASSSWSSSYSQTASVALIALTSPVNAFAGMVTYPTITDSTASSEVWVDSGSVNLYDNPYGIGSITTYAVSPVTFSLVSGSAASYIYVQSNNVTASYALTTAWSDINNINKVLVATVYRADLDTHVMETNREGLALANKLETRLLSTEKFGYESGFSLIDTGSRNIYVTSGKVWFGATQISQDFFDSRISESVAVPYDEVHWLVHSASAWTIPTQSLGQWQNGYYDDGANPVALAPNSYSLNYFWRILGDNATDDDVFFVTSNQQYSSVGAAQADQVPSGLPTVISDVGLLVGRMIFKSGSATADLVESAFTTNFGQSQTTNHNSLAGLQGGQGGEYYHLTAANYNQVVAGSASYASHASTADSSSHSARSISSSYALTTSNSDTSSYTSFASAATSATTATSASHALRSDNADTASYASYAALTNTAVTTSWANNATSASFASRSTTSSFAVSSANSDTSSFASYAATTNTNVTTSWANNSTSASFASRTITSSYAVSSANADSSSYATYASTTNTNVTVSYANSALSASWAPDVEPATASYANFALSSSWAPDLYPQTYQASGSWASSSFTSSYAVRSSNTDTASFATYASSTNTAITVSYANFATSASWAPGGQQGNAESSSWASSSFTSSYAVRASNADTSSFATYASTTNTNVTVSYANFATSASWAPGGQQGNAESSSWASSSFTSSYAVRSSNADTSSFATYASTTNTNVTVSYSNFALSASWAPDPDLTAVSASWASSSFTSSYAVRASTADSVTSSSFADRTITSSYALAASSADSVSSASFASRTITSSYAIEASAADTAISASYAGSTTLSGLVFSKGVTFYDPSGIAGTASLSQSIMIWRAPFAATASNVWVWKEGGNQSLGTASINVRRNETLNLITSSFQVTQSQNWVGATSLQNQNFSVGDELDVILITASYFPQNVAVQIDFRRQ